MKGTAPVCTNVPVAGSRVRALFDLLFAAKGRVVARREVMALYAYLPTYRQACNMHFDIERLVDTYGLDVRKMGHGGGLILAGEWFGKVYVDYIVERAGGAG